jgi:LysM repeat protein
VLRSFGLNAQERQGMTWDELRLEIAAGRPVIVWVIGQMWPGQPVSYTAEDGQTVTVAYYEHTMIVTGYTGEWVYVVDAQNGMDQVYDLNTFFTSWAVLGHRAIVLVGEPPAAPAPAEPAGESYVVQPGETLTGLAERFGISWRDLADYNQLTYPYMLYYGQAINLPSGSQLNENTPTPEVVPTEAPVVVETPQVKPGIYRIVVGDTLLQIAERYQSTWQELVQINQIKYPYFIYADQELKLPETAQEPTPTPIPATPTLLPTSTPQVYVVEPGDTLAKVGKKLGIDWREIAAKNGLGYPYIIYTGQVLTLP